MLDLKRLVFRHFNWLLRSFPLTRNVLFNRWLLDLLARNERINKWLLLLTNLEAWLVGVVPVRILESFFGGGLLLPHGVSVLNRLNLTRLVVGADLRVFCARSVFIM